MPAKFKTLGAWRWAAATVASRTMHLPDDAAGALMPFGDLHNHRSPPAATQPDLGKRAKCCFTVRVELLGVIEGAPHRKGCSDGSKRIMATWILKVNDHMQVS